MKPSLTLTLLLMLGVTGGAAFGQASFLLNNANVSAPVFGADATPLYGTGYLVELWGGATVNLLSPALTFETSQRIMVPFTHGPGFFVDGYDGRSSTDDLVVFDAPFGGYAWLEVRAWDARLGATYEDVKALGIGGYGESVPFYALGSAPGQLLPNIPANLVGLQSFSLRPIVPEPSTFALAGAGAVTLLVIRRRC